MDSQKIIQNKIIKKKISFIVCGNGLGHFKRVLSVCNEIFKISSEIEINIFCSKKSIDLINKNEYFAKLTQNMEVMEKNKLAIYGRMPLAKGLLTGKYKDLSKFGKVDPRSKNLLLTKKIINYSKKVKNLSAKNSVLWSLKHCQKVVLGFKNIDQIKNIIE